MADVKITQAPTSKVPWKMIATVIVTMLGTVGAQYGLDLNPCPPCDCAEQPAVQATE
jgi:disulfide bond formation protein DsbB